MRIPIASFICLLLTTSGHATGLFDQLRAFNPYWGQHHARLDAFAAVAIADEARYVQVHLAAVLPVLADGPTDHLTVQQRASRQVLMAELADYAQQGRFPLNHHRRGRIPVFIDEHDTFCAVGHLMRCSGHEALARRIAVADNYAWVRDITDPQLAAWQVASGFTLEELKLIQGAYDFYLPDAFLLPNKYEVPQKPEQVVRYFEGKDKVWCQGEGANGDLHGRWVQHYSATLPWIVGFFEHGKRSGRWKEYYKGTDQLCRTEHWRNDKLNGVRTRYDRAGNVIETILFQDGQAVTKTNIDLGQGLRYVRTPLDSATVHTEVFTTEGALIAAGDERIFNPEGLLWFQNIELTALNTFAITARDGAPRPEDGVLVPHFQFNEGPQQIPGSHQLVQYRKEGAWVYYKDYLDEEHALPASLDRQGLFAHGYSHFGAELFARIAAYDHLERTASYDSMRVVYQDDRLVDLFGYTAQEQDHLQLAYHPPVPDFFALRRRRPRAIEEALPGPVKQITRLDRNGDLIGVRVDYDRAGQVQREEHFLVPYKREEEMVGAVREGL